MKPLKSLDIYRTQCFIAGQWVGNDCLSNDCLPNDCAVEDTGVITVKNPANNEVLGHVPSVSAATVADAVEAANSAFEQWKNTPARVRRKVLQAWCDLMLKRIDDLALIITTEQGKPISESIGEVKYAADYLQWFAAEAERMYGDVIPAAQTGQTVLVQKEPIGVCACITPWNFPVAMLARKVAAALAAGCTVVAKPASATPLSALAFVALGEQAGLPKGVVNVVTGQAKRIGDVLCKHPLVKKISFTGSTSVGRTLAEQSAPSFKKLSLELGGNAPFIVFDDANLYAAVKGLVAAKFRNNGQTCVCVNRVFVHRKVHDAFVLQLVEAIKALKTGDAFDEATQQTVLINTAAVKKFNTHVQDALQLGGEILLGGLADETSTQVTPTLLKNATVEMLHCKEETFAPFLAVIPFDDEEEVVQHANDTPYGLAAYFYSDNAARVMRVSGLLQAGMIGVNETALSNVTAPFGGIKDSGMGREGSKYGLDDYTQLKYVLLGE